MSPATPPATVIELIPLGHAAEPAVIDVVLVADPLPRLEQLRHSRRRWQLFALFMAAAFTLVAILGAVQYGHLLVACKLLHDAREHADLARTETERALAENRKVYQQLHEDRRETAQMANLLDVALRRLGEPPPAPPPMLDPRLDRMMEQIQVETRDGLARLRQEGEEQVALIQLIAAENLFGPPVNRLVPVPPKADDE